MLRIHLLLLGLLMATTLAAAEPGVQYTDAATLTVIGKIMPTERPFNRVDTARHAIPAKALPHCAQSAGLAVVFRTDSRSISARWTTSGRNSSPNMTAIGQKGLDLYIRRNGAWCYAGAGIPRIDGRNDCHEARLVGSMEPGEKECLLYLPLFDRVEQLEIGTDPGSTILPMENPFRHRIVVHGSSITHGASASRAGMSYPALLARRTGMDFINFGFSGQCTMQPEFAALLADTEADAFVFDCFSNPRADAIDERFDTFVDIIRRKHPSTPLIFLQTVVRESGNFNLHLRQVERDKRDAAERQLRERMPLDPNLYFLDPGDLLGGDHNATVDGTHPTDLGFDRMLERLAPAILEILDKYDIR